MSSISPAIPCEGIDGSFTAEKNGSLDVRQYMGVKVGSDDNNVTPLDSDDTTGTVSDIVGIAQADADDGESVRVRLSGVSRVRAEVGVTRGDLCECIYDATEDKNGNMKTLTALADGKMIACRALEDAVDGEYFKAMILCQVQHPAWTS